jgi:hypothetical protein
MVPVKNGPKDWQYDPTGEMKRFGFGDGSVGGKVKHLAGDFEKPNGEWNELDLYTIGATAVYVVNGQVVNVLRQIQVKGDSNAGIALTGGQIQIQSEGAECYYRRMGIESIPDYPADIKAAVGL